MAVAFPTSLLISHNLPVDDKYLYANTAERNALPLSLRYKGMFVAVQGAAGQRVTYWQLNTDDLSNNGWEEAAYSGGDTIIIDDWKPNTDYLLNQPVVNDNKLYRANVAHMSGSQINVDLTKWNLISGESSDEVLVMTAAEFATYESPVESGLYPSLVGKFIIVSDEDGSSGYTLPSAADITVPVPPSLGGYTLHSVDGVLSWIAT